MRGACWGLTFQTLGETMVVRVPNQKGVYQILEMAFSHTACSLTFSLQSLYVSLLEARLLIFPW